MNHLPKENVLLLEIDTRDDHFNLHSSIDEAIEHTEQELIEIEETIISVQNMTNDADKVDYMLAASVGVLSGLMDIFIGNKYNRMFTIKEIDQWLENRAQDFAKLIGWEGEGTFLDAVNFLEEKYNVILEKKENIEEVLQSINLISKPFNLKYSPNEMGLFYAILIQFKRNADFSTDGVFITQVEDEKGTILLGCNITSKLYAGFINWLNQLIVNAPSLEIEAQEMRIPLPVKKWLVYMINLKNEMNIPDEQLNHVLTDYSVKIFHEGYDEKLNKNQMIPVLVNELTVRMLYSIRRIFRYFSNYGIGDFSFEQSWQEIEPFKNKSVKSMLTIAHGTFCAIDLSDAFIYSFVTSGGAPNPQTFLLKLNMFGIGRFTFSLYGETQRAIPLYQLKKDASFADRKKTILEDYLEGLDILAELYDDKEIIQFIQDFKSTDMYIEVFEKSIELAQKRNVPEEKILKDKSAIDAFFKGGE